ncbi:cell death-inducing p53-target protein 1-like [Dermatophagoides pteronyssinus]|uniref:cell death-inducing p53-target protein 1-like n=1 Tax=Dermatophagoides pteronyssinus TaxID=6956 RepID=UPI003F66686D
MSMYPNISAEASAPSAPGFVVDDEHHHKIPYHDQQPPYVPSYNHPPPPYSMGPNYSQVPQQQMGDSSNVVVLQPTSSQTHTTTVIMDKFPPTSIHMKCFFCQEDVKTVARPKSNFCTWLVCAGLCFIGCIFGCCLIPFCTDCSRDILHYCPKCKKYLGSYERFRLRI